LRSCRSEIVDRHLGIRSLCLSPDGLLQEGLLLEGLLEGLLVGWLLGLCWLEGGLVRGKGLAPVVLSGLMPDLRGLDRRLVPDLRRRGERRVSLLGVGVSVDGLLRPVGVCELRLRVGVLSRKLLQGSVCLPPMLTPPVVRVRLVRPPHPCFPFFP